MVIIDKWSLFGGHFVKGYRNLTFINMVVFIQRWSLTQVLQYFLFPFLKIEQIERKLKHLFFFHAL